MVTLNDPSAVNKCLSGAPSLDGPQFHELVWRKPGWCRGEAQAASFLHWGQVGDRLPNGGSWHLWAGLMQAGPGPGLTLEPGLQSPAQNPSPLFPFSQSYFVVLGFRLRPVIHFKWVVYIAAGVDPRVPLVCLSYGCCVVPPPFGPRPSLLHRIALKLLPKIRHPFFSDFV